MKISRSTICYLIHTVFLWSDIAVTSYFAACAANIRGWLLFEGSVYWFGKPGDTNNDWIRYERVRRWRSLDAVRSMCSLSVRLSAKRTTRTANTGLALAWWPSSEIICTRVCVCVLSCSYYSRAVFISFKSFRSWGYYSRAVSIQRSMVVNMMLCWGTAPGQLWTAACTVLDNLQHCHTTI